MTCDDCEAYQNGRVPESGVKGGTTYYRVDKANVELCGCMEHVATVIYTLNKYRAEHDGHLPKPSKVGQIRDE